MNERKRQQVQDRKGRWTLWQIQIIFTQRNQYCARIFVQAKLCLCGRNNAQIFVHANNSVYAVVTMRTIYEGQSLLSSLLVPHLHDGFPFLSHFFVNLWSTYFFVSTGNELLLSNGKLLFSLNEKQKTFWISVDILNWCSFWISWNLLGWLEWEYHWFQSDRMNS